MSAEKEVVNFWLNRKGYFTISNLKSGNKDVGLLALKFDEGILTHIMHVEVICSVSGLAEQAHVLDIIDEKFYDKTIDDSIKKYTKKISRNVETENVIVLNSLPQSKGEIIRKLEKNGVITVEFEDIISDALKELKTEYFKNDVIRTMQVIKFLLMQNPKKLVDVLYKNLSQLKMREFLAELLSRNDIVKEFRKTNEERLALILKQAMIKPERLAEILEKDVLNQKTRKPFITSFIERNKSAKVYKKQLGIKKDVPLKKFFY